MSRRLGLGLFYELSDGDFDAETVGVPLSIYLTGSLKLLLGAGVEKELFKDEEFVGRIGLQYDFHIGRSTLAPAAWVDRVNEKEIFFLGLAAGLGF